MKPVHMKMEPRDPEKDSTLEKAAQGPRYPYGLTIHVDQDELEKLGLDTLPAVGTVCELEGKGKVTNISASADDSGKRKSLTIQITHLAIDPGEAPAADKGKQAEKLYDQVGAAKA